MRPDPLLLNLKIDLLENIIDYAGDIKKCSDSITSQIREIIGTRVVAIFEQNPNGDYNLISACPHRKGDIFEKTLSKRLIAKAGLFDHAVLVTPGEGEAGKMVADLGMRESFFVPLRNKDESLGMLVLLDLMDNQGIHHILDALQDISGLLSLVLKNSFLYRNMETLVEQRTSELMESESRSRIILQTAMDGFLRVDANGPLLEVNDAYCEMVGYDRDELLKMTVDQLETNDSASEIDNRIREVLSGKKCRFETKHRRKNGGYVSLEICTQAHSEGHEPEIVVFIRDITERKQMEEERKQMQAQIQQGQKMETIGTLAGGIAHDFNNILAAILGYAEMAKDDTPPGTQFSNDLDKILIAANRAKDLVRQILTFSRQAQIERIPIKIQPLIKEGLRMLRSSIPTTISLTENIDPKSGVILVDPTQVHQILMNLCTNAYHAMEESGGALSVTLKTTFIKSDDQEMLLQVTPGEYVELTVSDTGKGIEPDILEKIFDPFFTTKGTGKGTGMGLSIIHGIMKEYGGVITVESHLGVGSTFHVFFPVAKADALSEIIESEDLPQGSERILFIDDEELLAEMGRDMLERLGYHVTVRRSSFEALAAFQNTPSDFDLVITDQTMPEITGADLARRMLQVRPDIPIILCTGYSNLIDEDSAKRLGIKEFALKPLIKGVMSKLIRKVLDADDRQNI